MNTEVQCGKCGEWTEVAVKSLRYIRCPVCHARTWLNRANMRDAATKEPVIYEVACITVGVSEIQRNRGGYRENW